MTNIKRFTLFLHGISYNWDYKTFENMQKKVQLEKKVRMNRPALYIVLAQKFLKRKLAWLLLSILYFHDKEKPSNF